MDGSTIHRTIIVEINAGKLIHIARPDHQQDRRAARSSELLLGEEQMIGNDRWIVFEDGYGIRIRQLKEHWDDQRVEVKVYNNGGNEQDYFDD